MKESRADRAFGLHRTIDQIGVIIGPVATFALFQLVDVRTIFLISLIPRPIAVPILVFFVKEVVLKRSTSVRTTVVSNLDHVNRDDRPFDPLLIITGIYSIGAFIFSFICCEHQI